MRRGLTTLGLAAALGCSGTMAAPPTIYRCGNTFSQTPCAETAVAVPAQDQRTPRETAQAQAAARREAKAADSMEKARLAQEARAPKALVMAPRPQPVASAPKEDHARTAKHHPKAKKPEYFTAVAPKEHAEKK